MSSADVKTGQVDRQAGEYKIVQAQPECYSCYIRFTKSDMPISGNQRWPIFTPGIKMHEVAITATTK